MSTRMIKPFAICALLLGGVVGSCGVFNPEGGLKKGYRFYIKSVEFSAQRGDDELVSINGGTFDLCDCTASGGQCSIPARSEEVATATLIIEKLDGFEFNQGLQLTLTHVVVDFQPVDSVDPEGSGATVDIPTLTVEYQNGDGPILAIESGGDTLEQEIILPFMGITQQVQYIKDVEAAVGITQATQLEQSTDGDLIGLYAFPRYDIQYQIWAVDNFGERVTATTNGTIVLGDFGDDCD